MSWPPKDPAELVDELFKAGYSQPEILAAWNRQVETAPYLITWKVNDLLTQIPNPDAMRLKQWFEVMRGVHNSISDVFLQRQVRAQLKAFFKLDEQTIQAMLAGPRASYKPVAPAPPDDSLPLPQVIEIELLRRIYLSQTERDWWTGRERLLSLWQTRELQAFAWLLIQIDSEEDLMPAVESGFKLDGSYSAESLQFFASLDFMRPMPETTEYLIAHHYNLTLPDRRDQVASQHQGDPRAALLAMADMKPIEIKALAVIA